MRRNRTNPASRLFVTAALVLTVTALAIGAAEWGAGWALKAMRDRRPAFSVDGSDDAIGKLYDSTDLARYREIRAESTRGLETEYSPFVEYRMTPRQGRHLTFTEDGYRMNGADSPKGLAEPGRKVFVFGGSTTMGIGVGNEETIPAYLEAALRAAGRADVQVYNFGVGAYYSTQERIALERLLTAGVKPDVAVFVDGLNDFYYCAVPDQTSWHERLTQLTRARSRMPLLHELAHRSNVVQLARHIGGDKSVLVHESGSFCESDGDLAKVIARLDTNRRMIDAIGERLGFTVIFVQQPVPTYSYDNRKRPLPVKEETVGFHMNSARGYPKLAEMRGKGSLWERNLLWLAEFEPAEGNAYIDTIHYSPRFNQAIAARIAAHLIEGGQLP